MATIKDISKKCHVSISTVSRALNGYEDINYQTKELVLKVAKELKYVPNKHARALVKGNSNNIVIIANSLSEDDSVYDILRGLYRYGEEKNYSISLFTSSVSKKHNKSYYTFCRENDIVGALIYGLDNKEEDITELLENEFPIVTINSNINGNNVVNVGIDNFKAANEAVLKLIKSGCKKIATIQGNIDKFITKERLGGYIDALAKNNIKLREELIYCGNYSKEFGEEAIEELFRLNEEVDGIFCGSDKIAMGVYKGLKRLGIKIPEQVAIVGFGDNELAEYLTPSLSTVKEDMFSIGYKGGEFLDKLIHNKKVNNVKPLKYQFIKRGSIR